MSCDWVRRLGRDGADFAQRVPERGRDFEDFKKPENRSARFYGHKHYSYIPHSQLLCLNCVIFYIFYMYINISLTSIHLAGAIFSNTTVAASTTEPHRSTLTEPEKNELALGILIFGNPPLSLFTVFGGVLGGVATIFCTCCRLSKVVKESLS